VTDDQDWRLEADLGSQDSAGVLDRVLGHIRGENVADDAQGLVGHDVAITHDGRRLFAYAPSEAALRSARQAIEDAARHDGLIATVTVSHWDHAHDDWRQVDPPLTGQASEVEDAIDRSLDTVESRTLVCGAGNWVRDTLEQSMRRRASELGIQCQVIEHPHLLRTQVAFTVTGPRGKLDEFRDGLRAEGVATLRADFYRLNPL
jgi:hypothetical protein